MKRLSLVAAVIAMCVLPGSAQAFQGHYDSYGYHMPTKADRAAKSKKFEGSMCGSPSFMMKNKKKAKATDVADEDATPAKKKKTSVAQGGGELSGGARPSISPVAPPKVAFSNSYGAGTIVIDTAGRKLYYVLSSSQAYRYPVAVGRDGFTWTGTHKISNEAD